MNAMRKDLCQTCVCAMRGMPTALKTSATLSAPELGCTASLAGLAGFGLGRPGRAAGRYLMWRLMASHSAQRSACGIDAIVLYGPWRGRPHMRAGWMRRVCDVIYMCILCI